MKKITNQLFNELLELSKGEPIEFKGKELLEKISINNPSTLITNLRILHKNGFIKYTSRKGRGNNSSVEFMYKKKLGNELMKRSPEKEKILNGIKSEIKKLKIQRMHLQEEEKRVRKMVMDACLSGLISAIDMQLLKKC